MVDSPLEYRSSSVSVVVQSQDGTLVGGDTLFAGHWPSDPSVRIYENDPLLGILFDHALSDTYAITGAEDNLYAAPFALPTSSGAPLLQWFLNGDAAQTGDSITLRPTGSGKEPHHSRWLRRLANQQKRMKNFRLASAPRRARLIRLMKKIIFLSALFFFAITPHVLAAGFTALAPIPGLTSGTMAVVDSTTLATFFNNLYKYLVGLAAVLAVIEIIWRFMKSRQRIQ